MTAKELAKNIINNLSDEANMDDIIHALYVRIKFERGLQEIEKGKSLPHEEAKQRMRSWIENS